MTYTLAYTWLPSVTVYEYCSGLDSDLPDILESDLEGRPDTNCYLEESWDSQGTSPFIQFALIVHGVGVSQFLLFLCV